MQYLDLVFLHSWEVRTMFNVSVTGGNILGPFRFVDAYGAEKLVDDITRFRNTYGDHFQAADMLKQYAKQNKKFY